MKHRHLMTALGLAVALAACKPAADEAKAPAADATPPAQPAPAEVAGPEAPDDADTAGKPDMPSLRVTTLDDKPYDLADHRGNWVVVNFWATWCAPCLKEMPELSALDAMREHVEVIGLAYEDIKPVELRTFLEKHPVVYPIAIVDVYDPPADFATPRGLPMTYLIAPGGKVAKRFLGPVTAKEIEGAIAAAGGPAIDAAVDTESAEG
ncbi:TlpA family protein disulfide reductase [Luteimonas soli]|uniref:TlpA family protein disulfide reductase n=1 Tax=Luteimonas soli TaxID=1648966 RepID=A0ABV7XH16_9GAMM